MTEAIRLSPSSLEDKLGWELHTVGGVWKVVVDVITSPRNVLVKTDDGTLYTYQRTDGVKVRPPEVEDECDGADRLQRVPLDASHPRANVM